MQSGHLPGEIGQRSADHLLQCQLSGADAVKESQVDEFLPHRGQGWGQCHSSVGCALVGYQSNWGTCSDPGLSLFVFRCLIRRPWLFPILLSLP